MFQIAAVCAMTAVLAACGATAPSKQNSSRVEPAKGGYDFKSEGKIPPPAGGSARPEADVEEIAVADTSLDVSEADAPPDTTPPVVAPVVSAATADGFRIQIFASADRDVAENARNVAASRLNMPAYLDLDGGVYKVRIGDYATREQATAALPSVRGQFYPDAWVVPARVNVPKAR
ncbi:MAG TPA: SPOR domain-containing protein [Candidatus Krumholzibacteria bacterium]|nr:SPOR domain-containing protein [Candidatus Krumholzibacteria bacterium]